ncbi:MAG: FecR family protein [Spirochaetota bacterium]
MTDQVIALMGKYRFSSPLEPAAIKNVLAAKAEAFRSITGKEWTPVPVKSTGVMQILKKRYATMDRKKGLRLGFAAAGVFCICLAVGAGILLTGGDDSSVRGAVAVFVNGNVSVAKNGAAPSAVKPGDEIGAMDVITTGKQSFVSLQVEGVGSVRVNENTTLHFSAVGREKNTVYLDKGSMYSKINKMKKGGEYEVRTMTHVAAVRGTEFLATWDGAKGDIKVRDGKVAVSPVSAPADEANDIVDAGKGVAIGAGSAKTMKYDLSRKDELIMEKMALSALSEDLTEEARKSKMDEISAQEKEIDVKISFEDALAKMRPLDRLRALGKPLTMISLKDGSQIGGSIMSQDKQSLMLDTGDGDIRVSKNDIIRRMPIK